MKFKLLVEQDNEGMFVAECPTISGCISQGKTKEEAIKNIHNAIKGFMQSYKTYSMRFPPVYNESLDKIPELSSENLINLFRKIGFEIDFQANDHYFIRQRAFPHKFISIPDYKKISKGTLKSIIKQSGLTIHEFNNLIKK